MVSMNCTTFAVEALKVADIDLPTTAHKWTLPDKYSILATLLNINFRGYTPSDAAEDFKNKDNYISYANINIGNTEDTSDLESKKVK